MSGFLLDTNVLSELRKESRCDPGVRDWMEQTTAEDLFVSVVVLGEIRRAQTRAQLKAHQFRRASGRWGLDGSCGPPRIVVVSPVNGEGIEGSDELLKPESGPWHRLLSFTSFRNGLQGGFVGVSFPRMEFMNHSQKLMKTYRSCLLVVALAGALHTLSAAEISGKVKLKGEPKPEASIPLEGTTCGPVVHTALTTRHYVVGPDKGLANVFVYIKKGASATPPAAGAQPVLDQVNCQYEPYVLGLVAGQKFTIRNSDPLMHNIHATPKNNKEFNFAQVTKGQVNNDKSFDKPEVLVRVKCDVHPWMFAYIGVVDHPYFAVTDKNGEFKISNVPAGSYTVEAFHLKAGAKQQELTLGASDKKTADFELEVPPPVQ